MVVDVRPSLCGIISLAIRNNRLPPDPLHSARVLPALRTPRSHRRAGPTRATAIVTVIVATKPSTSWWRGVSHPPPAAWCYTFEEFTNDDTADQWALAAAIYIAQHRRRYSHGPTFRELFEHLLPDTGGVPSRLPVDWDALDRRRGSNGFRGHVAIDWRRRGYISYDKQVTRSLRVGPRFREQSRALNAQSRERDDASDGTGSVDKPIDFKDSLSSDAARSLLGLTPTALRRFTNRGYLHAVECDSEWRYPSWQFAGRPRFAVVPGVDVVVPAIPAQWSLSAINSFMRAPNHKLAVDEHARSPVDWLTDGSDPHRVAAILEAWEASNAE